MGCTCVHVYSCIIINSMQKYQNVLHVYYEQHIHICTTYNKVYIFTTFNLCTDNNPVKSHYTVLPEGEVPSNYKFPKAIGKKQYYLLF